MADFEPIRGLVEEIPLEFLNNSDVKNLYHYCLCVQRGPTADPELLEWFHATPGTVTPARWVTTGSNILVVYMQTPRDSVTPQLKLLVKFILRAYAPTLFCIKQNWGFRNGPIHFFNMLRLSKSMLEKKHPTLYEGVKDRLQNNAHFAHLEAILVTMCHDQDPKVSQKGIAIIEKLRSQKVPAIPRKVRVPKINFEAAYYYDLIDMDDMNLEDFVSPPILSSHTIEDLKNKNWRDDYLKICCHSQHIERLVSITSEAAIHAIGQEKRHAWIINKCQVSQDFKTNFRKSDFNPSSQAVLDLQKQ